jgi:hypothetical protein
MFRTARWLATAKASGVVAGLCVIAALGAPVWAQSVVTYHNTPDRSGMYVAPALTPAVAALIHRDTGFDGTVNGSVYAQPLYWDPGTQPGRVIVATETNTVYALDASTGTVVWKTVLGPSVPAGTLPCGDITPSGITGTPVIDPETQALFVNALVDTAQGPHHQIFALSLANGAVMPGWPVDIQTQLAQSGITFDSSVQGERGALIIFGRRLFIPYGGIAGDCGTYHGWIVGLSRLAPHLLGAWSTRATAGGIWALGGIAFDGQWLYATTGNTRNPANWGDGEAVIRVWTSLLHSSSTRDYFAPTNWRTLDNNDQDLGGTAAIPLDVPAANGTVLKRVLALGKDGNAYLLDSGNLGGIGGALAQAHVSTGSIITAPATFQMPSSAVVTFYGAGAACPSGQTGNLTTLNISADKTAPISTAWCASFSGRGAPIVTTTDGTSNPIVWVAGAEGDNRLHGFRGADGSVVFGGGGAGDVMSGLRHFVTILSAAGRFYVAGDGRIYAFTY